MVVEQSAHTPKKAEFIQIQLVLSNLLAIQYALPPSPINKNLNLLKPSSYLLRDPNPLRHRQFRPASIDVPKNPYRQLEQ